MNSERRPGDREQVEDNEKKKSRKKKSDNRQSKNSRTLSMYARLCDGKVLNKAAEAVHFGVDERSIQRDLDDIRTFLDERAVEYGEDKSVVYDRQVKGFRMEGINQALMTNSEILSVCKILLESRAFSKKEMGEVLDKMIQGCVPQKNMKLVTDLISNEKFHYVEVLQREGIQEHVWDIGNHIRQCNLLELDYQKQDESSERIKRIVEPVAVLFSEYYFYLNAFIVEKDSRGRYLHKYNYPAIFRIDRILSYRNLEEKFKLPYTNRFQEGDFRKRVQFMYAGELIRLEFQYRGKNPSAILDRLPTARIKEKNESGVIIEAEVYGKGAMMWLLSQGDKVTILRPRKLREEMRELLTNMLKQYE